VPEVVGLLTPLVVISASSLLCTLTMSHSKLPSPGGDQRVRTSLQGSQEKANLQGFAFRQDRYPNYQVRP
jgi:hypothetical protein